MPDVRLIDANALKEWLGCDGDNKYSSMIMHEIADRIDEQPTIDAVEVVRCWKCKHYTPTICHRLNTVVTPFDFCSYGKPKTDAKEE